MRKLLLVLMMVALSIGIAMAAVTWHSGPTFTYNGNYTWESTGDGSGFGNQPASATITITGQATYTCHNKGGNVAQGQSPVTSTTTGGATLNADHSGRGVFDITVSFVPAATVNGKLAGCPNGNWTARDPVITGTPSAVLNITQASSGYSLTSSACLASQAVGPCPGF